MSQLVLKSLSILLGLFFIFMGILKVSPFINKELYKDMRKEFVKYAKVFPLVQTLKFKVPSLWYRRIVGGLEIVCGALLTFAPQARVKRAMNGILFLVTSLSVYSHFMVDDKFERTAPVLVFFFMLSCRLVVEFQQEKKQQGIDAQDKANKLKENSEKLD